MFRNQAMALHYALNVVSQRELVSEFDLSKIHFLLMAGTPHAEFMASSSWKVSTMQARGFPLTVYPVSFRVFLLFLYQNQTLTHFLVSPRDPGINETIHPV